MLPISSLAGIISQSGTQVVIAPGTPVTTLQVRATGAGTFPYSATVLPLEGQVPTGSTLQCVEDTSLRACILSTHSDGSASVVVVSGTTTVSLNQTKTLSLQTATIVGETNLNASRISSLLTDISLNFGSPYGTATISDFSSPERIWWATPTTICARYRIQPPTLSGTQLEAVIDVHAYASSTNALVEIVVENCKINAAAANPSVPSFASYSAATVTVNGSVVTTLNGNGAPEGHHSFSRAIYFNTWTGGDPGLRITQLYTDLQKHPLLFKCDQTSTADLSTYANDAYTPWTTLRQRPNNMGAGGDHDSIGPLPKWEAQALQTGDYRCWNAVEANALALVGYDINTRDISGLVPTLTQSAGKDVAVDHTWPSLNGYSSGAALSWEDAHQPAAGLMAFVSRPSPVFIELAQKVAIVNGTATRFVGDGSYAPSGVFIGYQMRAKAWCMRALAHATFLSPSGSAWKTAGTQSLIDNLTYLNGFVTDAKGKLNLFWDGTPSSPQSIYNVRPAGSAFGVGNMQESFLLVQLHKIASTRLLSGASQTLANQVADWVALWPIRFINEQADGRWRYISIGLAMGRNPNTIDSPNDWGTMREYSYPTQPPPSVSGTWFSGDSWDEPPTLAQFVSESGAGVTYPSYFWSALVAAVERNVAGVAAAWSTVTNNITNFSSWRQGFGGDPRWGSTPKVLPPPVGFGAGLAAGSFSNDVWTPGRDSSGLVNQASWDLVPAGRWVTIANSNLSALETKIKATVPAWSDRGSWGGLAQAWSALTAVDQTHSRFWWGCGGHSDSSNNGLYRFDVFNMAWDIESMPSDPTPWPGDYTNYTGYPPTSAAADAKYIAGTLSPINDVWYDELDDGKPTARHQYKTLMYMEDRNQLALMCRRLWIYDLTSKAWVYKRLFKDTFTGNHVGGNIGSVWSDENASAFYDPVTQIISYGASGSVGTSMGNYNLTTGVWGAPTVNLWAYQNTAMTRVGTTAVFVFPPFNPIYGEPANQFNPVGYTGSFVQVNADSSAYVFTNYLQFGAGTSATDFANSDNTWGPPSLAYVSSINRYWMWMKNGVGSLSLFEIDTTTTPKPTITKTTRTTGALPNLNTAEGSCGKMAYFPSVDTVVVFDLATNNMSLFRIS